MFLVYYLQYNISRIEYCRGYAVKNKNKCKKKFIFLKKVLQKIESPIIIINGVDFNTCAEIAQLVEHFTRNEGVEGSSPFFSSK